MALSSKTIISLACILSNKGELDTKPIEAQLTIDEQVRVEKAIEAGACLPQDLETLIDKTKIRIKKGEINPVASGSEPSTRC